MVEEAVKPTRRRWPYVVIGCFALVALALFALFARLQAQPIDAGQWITDQVEAQVDSLVPGARLEFRTIRVGMDLDYHPQIYLDDVRLTRADGVPLVDLRSVQGDVGVRGLLGGDVQLRRLELSGAVLFVDRSRDGSFDFSVSGGGGELTGVSDPGDVLEVIDELFERTALQSLSEVFAEGITVNYSDTVSGRAWTGDGGQVRFFREGKSLLLTAEAALLTGRQELATLSLTLNRDEAGDADVSVVLEDAAAQDIASQSSALSWLSVLDASVSGALKVEIEDGELGELAGSLELGTGSLRPNASTRPIPFSEARIALGFDPATQRLSFQEFWIDSAWGRASAEGTAQLSQMSGALPGEIVGQFQINDISANPGGLYDSERRLDRVALDFRLRLDPFTLDIGQAVAVDGATTALASGQVLATGDGWDVGVDIAINEVEAIRAMELWPVSVRPGLRTWFASNVEGGTIREARWAVRAKPDAKPQISFTKHFEEGQVRILRSLPPVRDAVGSVELVDARLTVLIEEGRVRAPEGGDLDASGTVFHVADTRLKPATADVRLAADGTITALLSTLDLEPFEFLTKANQPVTLADGRARVSGTLSFPLQPKITGGDVTLDMAAALSNVRSETLVDGKVLSMARAEARVTNEALTIGGRGTLGQVAFDGAWAQVLGQGPVGSELRGEVELSPAALDEFRIALPPGSVQGEGRAELALALPPGAPPEFTLTSDLRGLRVAIAPVGWVKQPVASGSLIVSGSLGPNPVVRRLALAGPGLDAEGRLFLTPGGQGLDRMELDDFNIGNWLTGALTLRGRGAGVPPAVELRRAALDLRSAQFGQSNPGAEGPPLDVVLDRLIVSDDIVLTGLSAQLTTTGGLLGVFQARMGGGAPLSGSLQPTANGPMVTIQSQDGGGVIRDAGIFRQVRGGQLALTLVPQPGQGIYDGTLDLADIRVEDAPSMAELLSAISVVGLLEQLDGQGLVFNEVDAQFRITPQQVIITEASAVGASLGLSLDGIFDTRARRMDFQGVVSPLYLINGIGSFLTRRGEGLIGFNFTLRGPAASPDVAVNPLSALTPGMFREIFRRPPPQVSQ
ncbi:MAG: DUF3971 domain-containing protein [Pseudomonadota bacterium]